MSPASAIHPSLSPSLDVEHDDAPLIASEELPSPKLSIFTIPKPFVGHSAVIQRNAIESWRRLTPSPEIILCGDESGTAEIAQELGVRHLPNLARNEFGTPFLHSAFEQVRRQSRAEMLCYINADIILLDDFTNALEKVDVKQFLFVGQRWDVDIDEPWDFKDSRWREKLISHVHSNGKPHSLWGIDFFVFPKHGLMDRLPPFVVGRPGWDNWVIYNARNRNVPVIDASAMMRAIHQNHDYNHVPLRTGDRWVGPEAQRQVQLLSELMHGHIIRFAIVDATHKLTKDGIIPMKSLRSMRRKWETLPVLRPKCRTLHRVLNPAVRCADFLWRFKRLISR